MIRSIEICVGLFAFGVVLYSAIDEFAPGLSILGDGVLFLFCYLPAIFMIIALPYWGAKSFFGTKKESNILLGDTKEVFTLSSSLKKGLIISFFGTIILWPYFFMLGLEGKAATAIDFVVFVATMLFTISLFYFLALRRWKLIAWHDKEVSLTGKRAVPSFLDVLLLLLDGGAVVFGIGYSLFSIFNL